MKINLLAAGAFVAALALPLGVCAQQSQPPQSAANGHTTPSQARIQHRWARRFGSLNLSGDQQQRVQSIIGSYAQAHPQGSPVDRQATRELKRQLMGVLTSDQQNQFHQQMRARRAQMQQRREQSQGQNQQYQQGAQYQQAPQDQRYQQGPPDQQYQQAPPDQQYQQAPPNQQYQQAPPDQQGPPDQDGQPSGPPPA